MTLLGNSANLLLVLIGFGLLVAVHEFGHFIAAKWAGVRVESFAVGMGPTFLAYRKGVGVRFGSTDLTIRKRAGKSAIELSDAEVVALGIGETEYSLRLLPLGGFVRMLGQDDLDPKAMSTHMRSYNRVPVWKRMIIVSGGVALNIVLALGLFIVAFMIGVQFEAPIIGSVLPASPAAAAGVRAGDRVTAINGEAISTFADLQIAAAMGRGDEPIQLTIDRVESGAPQLLTLDVTPRHDAAMGVLSIGLTPAASTHLTNDLSARPFLFGALTRAGFWHHAPDGMASRAWGISDPLLVSASGTPSQSLFDEHFRGATLLSVQGRDAHSYDALDQASASSHGKPLATRWQFTPGGVVDIAVECAPTWQVLEYTEKPAAATIDYEPGLLGMSPLVRIGRVPTTSASNGILHEGDVVLRVGDVSGPRQMEFRLAVQSRAGSMIALRVLRGMDEVACNAPVGRDGKLGLEVGYAWETPLIARPFAVTGPPPGVATAISPHNLLPLTRIESVDGHSIGNWIDLFRVTKGIANADSQNTHVTFTVTPPTPFAQRETITVALDASTRGAISNLRWRPALGSEWFAPAEVVLTAGGDPLRAISMGFNETKKMVLLTYLTLDRLFRGTVGVAQLRGPVGIIHIGTRVADRGMTYLLFFLAMISVNLAVINFLPIPIADGGLMVFLLYEKLRGKPPSPSFQSGAMVAGLVLVGLLFAVTFYNDVMRLVT
ncbi:MAG: PDZ domain-containing protein [Phycisphaerales bacterium]|nr:PDZ domain-containing protein [Phycisphaerales bacterium]